mmetsp:Transcript_46744/g.111291  ORF Transcript_46744/g.111291 Transcript_46744/m.111291 type:complete len:660 (+) Transcript_46744:45-2024(+)
MASLMQNSFDETPRTVVAFRNLNFDVTVPDDAKKGGCSTPMQEKTILKNLTGAFKPGRITAILGTSGAGKTTLLNVVAGESAGGVISGDILLNGKQVETNLMRRVSAFVFQDDVMMTTMTVREAILFSARLRLPASVSIADKKDRVEKVIHLMHLAKCADTIIGSATDKGGISGGERKRTSIGMELITNPSVLFLDEPTTGLDTYTAFSIVDTLRQLAASGRTVVATIHQPSSDMYHLFDDLLILAHGQVLYQGPRDASVDYFRSIGYSCPAFTNPADFFFMRVLNDPSGKNTDTGDGKSARMQALLANYMQSEMRTKMELEAARPGAGVDVSAIPRRAGPVEQMGVLMTRSFRNIIRNPMGLRAKSAQVCTIGLIIALIYLNTPDSQAGVQSRTGALFFLAMNMMNAAFGVLPVFGLEMVVFKREQALGMYNTPAFFITKVLTELPMSGIILPIIQICILYWAVGFQNSSDNFILFCAINICNTNAGIGIGMFIASLFSDLRVVLVVAPPLILPLMIFSGMFINTESIPVYFDWIKYISPIKWAFELYAVTEYRGLKLRCLEDEYRANPSCPKSEPKCYCPLTTGEQVLKVLSVEDTDVLFNMMMLLVLWFGTMLLAFCSLMRVIRKREGNRAKTRGQNGSSSPSGAVISISESSLHQ